MLFPQTLKSTVDPWRHLFISESTYATTIRDSKRVREREFLQQVRLLSSFASPDQSGESQFYFPSTWTLSIRLFGVPFVTSTSGACMCGAWGQGAHPGLRAGPSAGALHFAGDILGADETFPGHPLFPRLPPGSLARKHTPLRPAISAMLKCVQGPCWNFELIRNWLQNVLI